MNNNNFQHKPRQHQSHINLVKALLGLLGCPLSLNASTGGEGIGKGRFVLVNLLPRASVHIKVAMETVSTLNRFINVLISKMLGMFRGL